MSELRSRVEAVAGEHGFAGVVRVDRAGETLLDAAFGAADRAHGIPMTTGTRLAVASGSKTFTALAVLSLVEQGVLALGTTARSVLGPDLPLVADDVTVEHLLAHRSGIGDYFDEETEQPIEAYALPVPVHTLATTEGFLPALDGFPTAFPAGERFAYCNGGFVVLALIAERVSGVAFHDLVDQRVLGPAGMAATGYLRTDELPGDAGLGYVEIDGRWRSNVLHLPVRGNGDGGAYSTTADLHRFWPALLGGAIVGPGTVEEMLRPRSLAWEGQARYGLGIWLGPPDRPDIAFLEGYDAGVSFRSTHDRGRDLTWTVIANTSPGAWPVVKALDAVLAPTG